MSDRELLTFVEEHGIQIWPLRVSKHGPIRVWYTQNVTPFIQTHGSTLRRSLERLHEALDLHGTD